MATYRNFRNVVVQRFKEDSEEVHAYLQVALEAFQEDGDTKHLLLALRTVAEAQGGVLELARRIDMERMTLHKASLEKGNPTLSTIYAILRGLSYKLMLVRVEKQAM